MRTKLRWSNEAEAAVQGAGAGLEGRLRVSVPVTFSRVHRVRQLASFLDARREYWGEQGHRL